MTPCRYPNFNSCEKSAFFGILDRQTDGQTEREINSAPGTFAAHVLEELFFHCLRKVPPAQAAGEVHKFGW
jgi:hypothetical protein